jgi:ribonuclease BN (tRNA processing enzyme)
MTKHWTPEPTRPSAGGRAWRPDPPQVAEMRVTVIGCGDAFGSGGRFNAATLVETHDGACLLDCGASTMTALNALGVDPDRVSTVLITHLHGDHFGGVPFLLLDAQWVRQRTRPLTIAGPPGTRRRLHATLEALFAGASARTPWTFPWRVEEIDPDCDVNVDDFAVRTTEVVHPSGAPATAIRLAAAGKTFVHSGDTEWTEALPSIAAGADLLFLECFAFEPTPTHLDYGLIRDKRSLFDAKRIVLTHMGPTMLDRLGEIDTKLFDVADDGRVFEL